MDILLLTNETDSLASFLANELQECGHTVWGAKDTMIPMESHDLIINLMPTVFSDTMLLSKKNPDARLITLHPWDIAKDINYDPDIYNDTDTVLIRARYLKFRSSNKGSLVEWFLSLDKESHISGFVNRWWTGVTDLALSKIIRSIALDSNLLSPGSYIACASDYVSRYQLINYLAWGFKRHDLYIDRTPSLTENEKPKVHDTLGSEVWAAAGYSTIPTVHALIDEQAEYFFDAVHPR